MSLGVGGGMMGRVIESSTDGAPARPTGPTDEWAADGAAICEVYLANLEELRPDHDGLLSSIERARCAEFRQTDDRRRYTLATALLRIAVGHTCGDSPGTVQLDRTCSTCGRAHGPPRLVGTRFHASISHADDLVAVAVTAAGRVGVDVERIRPGVEEELASVACAVEELEHVRSADDFFVYWTRKEAVVKATGEGVRRPLADVVVSPPDELPNLVALGGSRSTPCRMADLDVGGGYKGAVAVLTDESVDVVVRPAASILSAP